MELVPGAVVVGRYRVDRKIGMGGMAEVWAARNIAVGTAVALKRLSLSASANAEVVVRFRREAYLLGCVRSDHVTRVLDFASDETYGHVLVTDLVSGEALYDVVARRALRVEEGIDLACDLARGLADLHNAKVVHRDLKPGNIILEARPGGRFRAVIVDFGLGRLLRDDAPGDVSAITSVDTALGTLEYMAPEQILNSRGATPASDIYSVGAIIYRSVTGRHMFGELDGADLAQAKLRGVPPPAAFTTGRTDKLARGLEAIVHKALSRYPDERYQRAEDLLADLVALHGRRAGDIEDEPTTQSKPSPVRGAPSIPDARPSYASVPDPRTSLPSFPPAGPPRQERPPAKQRGPAFLPLLLFFTALGAMLAGALIGSIAERMRMRDMKPPECVPAGDR